MTNYKLNVDLDPYPKNPREWENVSKMLCTHRRYALGDKHDINLDDFDSWNDIIGHLVKKEKAIVIMPLYLYDHSGLTIRTTPFSCPWDSGQVGLAYVTKATALEEAPGNPKYIAKNVRNWAKQQIVEEVKTYDQYLRGDVWEYQLFADDEVVDSCSGYYGWVACHTAGEKELQRWRRRKS